MWQFQSPELYKGVSIPHSDLCVNGTIHWIIAAYLFPYRMTNGKQNNKTKNNNKEPAKQNQQPTNQKTKHHNNVLKYCCFISENIEKTYYFK